jgi:alkyldihydroxyacetonephosphate synthase
MSSRYGKIEDMVEQMEVVLADGRVVELFATDLPDLCSLIVGSEGTLGIITKATMRVHPLADHRIFRAYEFPRIAAGCEGIRRVMQRGTRRDGCFRRGRARPRAAISSPCCSVRPFCGRRC